MAAFLAGSSARALSVASQVRDGPASPAFGALLSANAVTFEEGRR
jgi:hypothetical protein